MTEMEKMNRRFWLRNFTKIYMHMYMFIFYKYIYSTNASFAQTQHMPLVGAILGAETVSSVPLGPLELSKVLKQGYIISVRQLGMALEESHLHCASG